MDLRILVLISTLAISGPAASDIVTQVDFVEVTTSNISVPTAANGHLMFRPCAEKCDEQFTLVRLTPESEFIVRGQSMTFAEFRQSFLSLGRGSDTYALIGYDTQRKTVTSIRIGF